MQLLAIVFLIGITSYAIYRTARLIRTRRRMKFMERKENALKEAGVTPYGSSLSYGVSIDSDGRYVHESKQSLIWYKRLLV